MNNNICIISKRPRAVWLDFFAEFTHYKVFFLIHNAIGFEVEEIEGKYPMFHFIHVDDDIRIHSHFCDDCSPYEVAWHKALYYFSMENLNFDNTWFLEDDVFFHNENTLRMIDDKYSDSDYLSSTVSQYDGSDANVWHWYQNHETQLYNSMVYVVRMSRTLLQKIDEYAQTNNTLFYIEAMLPTIAHKNNLICNSPDELTHIYHHDTMDLNLVRPEMVYHPIRCADLYPIIRRYITDVFFKR